jgi:hypothetical protein
MTRDVVSANLNLAVVMFEAFFVHGRSHKDLLVLVLRNRSFETHNIS